MTDEGESESESKKYGFTATAQYHDNIMNESVKRKNIERFGGGGSNMFLKNLVLRIVKHPRSFTSYESIFKPGENFFKERVQYAERVGNGI